MTSGPYPPWLVLHVPHDSALIPEDVRPQFLLDDTGLQHELMRMTDHQTLALFADASSSTAVVRSPVSRLVVDVERFPNDRDEPMAARGMGAVYTITSQLTPLRRQLTETERESLMQRYYLPHHARLEKAVTAAVEQFGRCLIIDCHSFPGVALPYEMADPAKARPDICIGTDDTHTGEALASAFVSAFRSEGWSVSLNEPFRGALVPASRYRKDRRVEAVMVEINRRLYLRETDATLLPDFPLTAERIRRCCRRATGQPAACG